MHKDIQCHAGHYSCTHYSMFVDHKIRQKAAQKRAVRMVNADGNFTFPQELCAHVQVN